MCAMDSLQEHAENEDKHLISQVAGMTNYGDTVSLTTNNESRSLDWEQGRHLASVVIGSSNILSKTIVINSILDIDFNSYFYVPFFLLELFIHDTCNICKTVSQCKCDCSCSSRCTENTICLCSCNSTKDTSSSGCCICICKKQSSSDCPCICICICENGEKCCCGDGSQAHQCKQLLKVDIGSLKVEILTILDEFEWIRSFIPKSTEQCVSVISEYKWIITTIASIELHFVQITQKMNELIKLKTLLSSKGSHATKCPKIPGCNCKEKVSQLVANIENSEKYYSIFASRIRELVPFISYKVLYPKSKEILSISETSVKCFSHNNRKIINDIIKNMNYTTISDKMLFSVYSKYSIYQCYLGVNILLKSSKIYKILHINQTVENCRCLSKFKSKNTKNGLNILDFHQYLFKWPNKTIKELKNLFVTDGNHLCICLVIKYLSYPSLIKSLYYLRYFYLEALSKQNKEFIRNRYSGMNIKDIVKMLFIIIGTTHKISTFIQSKKSSSECFCKSHNDPYYPYLVSIILYLSSLIENIWAKDNHGIVTAIESLSNLMSELKSYDFTSIKDIKKICSGNVCGLVVDKKCPGAKTQNCCWCVPMVNLIVACVSICVQFRFYEVYKKLCNKNNDVCKNLKEFCKIEELECKCECKEKEKNGVCCLLKLGLCSQLCNSTDVEKLLGDCCKSCNDEQGCCKKILAKVKEDKADLLVVGCNCESEAEAKDIKTWCVIFKNPWDDRIAAVVIVCKCKEPTKCCCLAEALKKIQDPLKNLCEDQCQCQDLTKVEEICKTCCEGQCEICKGLKDKLKEICGQQNQCLCTKIDGLKNLCTKPDCQCKKAEECCRCVCCKLLVAGVRVLVRACKQNFLEPYKRITIELLSGSTDNQVIRSIVNSINSRTLSITYLLKNNYRTHFNTYSHHKNIANRFPSLTVGYAYDSVYEHQEASNSSYTGMNSIRKADPNIRNRRIKIRNKL